MAYIPGTEAGVDESAGSGRRGRPDLLCFSHLRWDFVYQRPQHVIGRFARRHRVFFIEEPVPCEGPARLDVSARPEGVQVVVPRLPAGLAPEAAESAQRQLLDELLARHDSTRFVCWYYTPMAIGFSAHLSPVAVVYDCMDELSLFRGAPAGLLEREERLLQRADLVFTGGPGLYEAKRGRHPDVHLFPSSIDAAHFRRARGALSEPTDQASIPRPRLGYFGVIDERMDLHLLAGIADARPDWQLVMIGPVVKIETTALPARPNLHYLGARAYGELPAYIAGWNVALLPFARNESTRFISPTKTPEYLAAGRPVVSTPIRDVVRPYAAEGLVRIAAEPAAFVQAIESALAEDTRASGWLERVDAYLAGMSWDRTQAGMALLLDRAIERRRAVAPRPRTRRPAPAAHRSGAVAAG